MIKFTYWEAQRFCYNQLDSLILMRHGAKRSTISPIIHHVAQPKIEGQTLEVFFFFMDGALRMRSRNDSRPLSSHIAGSWAAPSIILHPIILGEVSLHNQVSFKKFSNKQNFLCDTSFKCSPQRYPGSYFLQTPIIAHRMSQMRQLVISLFSFFF